LKITPFHILLGVLTAAIWGFNFVVLKVALRDIPPILLTALRFIFACLPVLFLPKPAGLTWRSLIIVGLTSFLGQYVLLFAAMALGMPAGLSSVTLQLQVFLTILISVVLTNDRPTSKQVIGCLVALAGLGTIAATVGQGTTIPLMALLLVICSATVWAFGNIETRKAGPAAKFGTVANVAWCSLVPIIPALGLSVYFEGADAIASSLQNAKLISWASLAFTVVLSTWAGFAMWGKLMSTYPASLAAPFALLVPVFGGLSAYLVLDETLSPQRLGGSALIFLGLAVILLPLEKLIVKTA
jgi:O-acetylserine/cysteine efflux transporter